MSSSAPFSFRPFFRVHRRKQKETNHRLCVTISIRAMGCVRNSFSLERFLKATISQMKLPVAVFASLRQIYFPFLSK